MVRIAATPVEEFDRPGLADEILAAIGVAARDDDSEPRDTAPRNGDAAEPRSDG